MKYLRFFPYVMVILLLSIFIGFLFVDRKNDDLKESNFDSLKINFDNLSIQYNNIESILVSKLSNDGIKVNNFSIIGNEFEENHFSSLLRKEKQIVFRIPK